jgi:hypothetical protein
VPVSDFHLNGDEAEAIGRLSALEHLREQARQGNRTAMLTNIEKLIEAELRAIQRLRANKATEDEHPTG